MSEAWYCQVMGVESGPHTLYQLKAMARDNRLQPDNYVRQRGGDWILAERVPGLFSAMDAGVPATLPGQDGANRLNGALETGPAPPKRTTPAPSAAMHPSLGIQDDTCPRCGGRVIFPSTICVACGSSVGTAPEPTDARPSRRRDSRLETLGAFTASLFEAVMNLVLFRDPASPMAYAVTLGLDFVLTLLLAHNLDIGADAGLLLYVGILGTLLLSLAMTVFFEGLALGVALSLLGWSGRRVPLGQTAFDAAMHVLLWKCGCLVVWPGVVFLLVLFLGWFLGVVGLVIAISIAFLVLFVLYPVIHYAQEFEISLREATVVFFLYLLVQCFFSAMLVLLSQAGVHFLTSHG